MIIESKGIKTDKYFIPPFHLQQGEIVIIYLYHGAHFYDTEMELVKIFTSKTFHQNVKICKPLTFIADFKESKLRHLFYPVTAGEYSVDNSIDNKIKVRTLSRYQQKLLSLYAAFTHSAAIVFDLRGLGAIEAEETYEVVKTYVKNGGAAILLEGYNEMKDDCTKFITIEWLVEPK